MLVDARSLFRTTSGEVIPAGFDIVHTLSEAHEADESGEFEAVNTIRPLVQSIGNMALNPVIALEAQKLSDVLEEIHARNVDAISHHFQELPMKIHEMFSRTRQGIDS